MGGGPGAPGPRGTRGAGPGMAVESRMPSIVALLTDFGQRDFYAGATRGSVLAACPEATLVDISHEIPAQDVREAALCLAAACPAFPAGTVFLAVVDPEVGSSRRGIAVEARGYRFVAPDNGILSYVLDESPGFRAHQIANASWWRPDVSPTFHARDVFAPVAGRLAAGKPIEEVGPPVADPVRLAPTRVVAVNEDEWEGAVVHVDRFGNLVTSFTAAALSPILSRVGFDPTAVVVVVEGMVLPLVRTYAEVAAGEACGLIGGSGRLEVAVNQGSAEREVRARRGAAVRVRVLTVAGPAG
jgi:S-adenosyl-L-methionine hydrolase (adenosine-forming)